MFVLTIAHSNVILFSILAVGVSLVLGHLHTVNGDLIRANVHLLVARDRLAKRTESLSHANEELQRFAYALAHDLNTPLRGISALADLLVERNAEKLDESSKECAGMIVSRVQRMQSTIKGLLDFAAAVEKPAERAVVDCNDLVGRAIQDLDSVINECGAQITVDRHPRVRATESHLLQAFTNLLSSALKYGPSVRSAHITVSAKENENDWVFCVADNGIGLDMKHANQIFGIFRPLHGEDEYEGSGIGLALCKIVVERHEVSIWVESELGKGSRFFFALPKAVGESGTSSPAPGSAGVGYSTHRGGVEC